MNRPKNLLRNLIIGTTFSLSSLSAPLETYAQIIERQEPQNHAVVLPPVIVEANRIMHSRNLTYILPKKEPAPSPLEKEEIASNQSYQSPHGMIEIERNQPSLQEPLLLPEEDFPHPLPKIRAQNIEIERFPDPISFLPGRFIERVEAPVLQEYSNLQKEMFSVFLQSLNRRAETQNIQEETSNPYSKQPVEISGIVVEANKNITLLDIPQGKKISHRDPYLELLLKEDLGTPVPGITVIPQDNIPYGLNTFFKKKVSIVTRETSGFGSFSMLPSDISLTRGEENARTPSIDLTLFAKPVINEGINAYLHPLRTGLSAARTRDNWSGSLSLEYLQPLNLVKEDILPDELKALGEGPKLSGFFKFGKEKNVSLYFYAQEANLDLSDIFDIPTYEEESGQQWFITDFEHPLGDLTLKGLFSRQSGLTSTRIVEPEKTRELEQGINVLNSEISLNNWNTEVGLGLYRIERTNTNKTSKKFSGLQLFADRTQHLSPLDIMLSTNAKVDFVEGESPAFSFFGSLERQVDDFTVGVKFARLSDYFTPNKMGETTVDFYPTTEVSPQKLDYEAAFVNFNSGNHEISASIETRRVSPNSFMGDISGFNSSLGWKYSGDRLVAQLTGIYRPMKMNIGGEEIDVPGTPRKEFRGMIGLKGDSYLLTTSLSLSDIFIFPYKSTETVNLGRRIFGNISFSKSFGSWDVNVTVNNWLKLLNLYESNLAYYEREDGSGRFFRAPAYPVISIGKKLF
jgi:hypothetical protein